MKIMFSNSDYLAYMDRFINNLDLSHGEFLEIYTHPKWINTHPAFLTFAATLAMTAGSENTTIKDVTAVSGAYLERMGLYGFAVNHPDSNINKKDPCGRFIPLTIIKDQRDQSAFITEMIPLLHLPPDKTDPIKYMMGELIRNVLEHSKSDSGAVVAAQYYKEKNIIRLGICDNGIGIRKSMERFWPGRTDNDLSAIKWALVPGVSGTTSAEGGTEDNAGAGLFFVKSIARVARNYFMIYSGSGIYKLLLRDKRYSKPRLNTDPDDDEHSERTDAPYFQGTLVAIDISLDQTEEFDSLLALIRSAYSRAIRERKAKRYIRPRFV